MYVCVWLCVFSDVVHKRLHTHTHVYIYIYKYIYIYICIYIYIYMCVRVVVQCARARVQATLQHAYVLFKIAAVGVVDREFLLLL